MLNRKVAPQFRKEIELHLPHPDSIQLPRGLPLHVITGVQQEVSKLEFVLPAGKWYEPKIGASHFTAQMLDKGTRQKSSAQIAAYFDQYGAHVEINPGNDFISVALYSLNKNMDFVLPLFLEILKEPSFPEAELRQVREIFIQNLKINNEKTSFLASRAIRKNIFGNDHPYGSLMDEPEAVNLSPSDLVQFHKDFFNPSQIFLVTKSDRLLVEGVAGRLSEFEKGGSKKNQLENSVDPYAEKIKKENTVQASIRLGKKTIARDHPDYFNLLLINHVLGGYFGSRLMKNIREEKGLTYGIYSSVNSMAHAGLVVIGADVNKENVELTIAEIKNEITKLRSIPVDTDELESAKGHFIGSLQAEIANPFAVAEKIKTIKLFSLPHTYYQDLIRKVDSATPEELVQIAQRHLNPDDLFQVVAG